MIQRIEHTSKKSGDSMFVFFISKWSKIKDSTEIEKYQLKKSKNLSVPTVGTGNIQFSNSNHFKALKISSLSQIFNADSEEVVLDSESVLRSKADLENINNNNLIITFLATNAENSCNKGKKDKQTNHTNEKKQDNFADKIFDYIYIAQCRRLFSLACYNDMIYI